ncbi:short-chain dehydrogenase protein [Rutstroemia sp. NJR-2017a BBW]|nr:short-chain dehydrogenase protein [Rutstroemia sp. NJR-2017a BBW]
MSLPVRLLNSRFLVTVPKPRTSFKEKTVIITGGNTGLGFEAAKQYLSLNASKVILACRSLEKATAAKISLEGSSHCAPDVIETWEVDLSSYHSVIRFCEKARQLSRIDVLLLNAGIMTTEFRMAEDNESTLTVNFVSTFLMGFLLMPKLKETADRFGTTPHMTAVSSDLHLIASFAKRKSDDIFGAMNRKEKARMADRYNTSKLMLFLIVRQFVLLRGADFPVVLNTVNPGFSTEAGRESHGKYISDGVFKCESSFVTSKAGAAVGEKLWKELATKLERISPGVIENL